MGGRANGFGVLRIRGQRSGAWKAEVVDARMRSQKSGVGGFRVMGPPEWTPVQHQGSKVRDSGKGLKVLISRGQKGRGHGVCEQRRSGSPRIPGA